MIFDVKFEKDSTIPLLEYPRPQFKRQSYLCLNGFWDYKIERNGSIVSQGKINVPYSPESDLSGVLYQVKGGDVLTYQRTFTLPKDFNEGVVLLNFGACDQETTVYVNGEKVGENYGGYLPFTFDITAQLKDGENTLKVVVLDDANSDIYGRGKQTYKRGGIWYTATSGIWQTVFLESVPKNYIRSIKLTPDYDEKTLKVTADTVGSGEIKVEVLDGDTTISTAVGASEVTLDVSRCKEWNLNFPELYKVFITFCDDKVESYFGLRKFSIIERGGYKLFALNNKPVFNNGLLDQGYYHKGFYTPESNKRMYDDVLTAKTLGYNMLRKHIKVEPLLWYYYCDVLGVLVWQDMINGGAKYKSHRIMLAPFINLKLNDKNYKSMGRSEKSREQYYKEAYGLQDLLYNVVSLCVYTPFNEAWGQFDAVKVTSDLRKRDNTRLYDHASGWQDMGAGDFQSRHIYFRKARMKNDGKRILALTEFGGYSLQVKGHVFSNKKFGYKFFKTQKDLENAYENLYENEIIPLIKNQGLCATVYTELTDVEDEVNGILTFDRALKLNRDLLVEINGKIYETFDEKFNK